ncbi:MULTISPECIES: papain fold toxin domain-containing protein [unclassified Pseudomonas]|uniref:papain fold toxin domain-containing protein n=1 Tax=Pseudomonas sp. GV071 TaxID=2135754 RepID=UPI000D344083
MFRCKGFTAYFKEILQEKGVEGVGVTLKSDAGYIWSEVSGKTISTNGDHVGVKVTGLIFDNLNPPRVYHMKNG